MIVASSHSRSRPYLCRGLSENRRPKKSVGYSSKPWKWAVWVLLNGHDWLSFHLKLRLVNHIHWFIFHINPLGVMVCLKNGGKIHQSHPLKSYSSFFRQPFYLITNEYMIHKNYSVDIHWQPITPSTLASPPKRMEPPPVVSFCSPWL